MKKPPHLINEPPGSTAKPMVILESLSKHYVEGGRRHAVLNGIDAEFHEGEISVIVGKSGSGKTTLLNLISGTDVPDSGKAVIGGKVISGLSENERTLLRRERIGLVFQFFNLIPTLTVLENIVLPCELRGGGRGECARKAEHMLGEINLDGRAGAYPDVLSGGEQQRVGIARALINDPDLILADEPTGNLDSDTARDIMELFLKLVRGRGKTMIIATHSPEVIGRADRIYRIKRGALYPESAPATNPHLP